MSNDHAKKHAVKSDEGTYAHEPTEWRARVLDRHGNTWVRIDAAIRWWRITGDPEGVDGCPWDNLVLNFGPLRELRR